MKANPRPLLCALLALSASVVISPAQADASTAAIQTAGEPFPCRERTLANGAFNSGSDVGPIPAPLLVPWLKLYYRWPIVPAIVHVLVPDLKPVEVNRG